MKRIPRALGSSSLTIAGILTLLLALTLSSRLAFAPPAGRPMEFGRFDYTRPGTDFHPLGRDFETGPKAQHDLAEIMRNLQAARRDLSIVRYPDFSNEQAYSIDDGQPDSEAKAALNHYLDLNPTAQQIGMNAWRFTTAPTLSDVANILRLSDSLLPGKLELGLMLDPTVFGSAHSEIVGAWGARPKSDVPTDSLIDDYLAAHRGSTLIVVGHVEGKDYVLEHKDGTKDHTDIGILLAKAHLNGVVLVLLGCKTADAGVSIGFINEIGTDAVSTFLRSFPSSGAKISHLLSGLRTVGDLRIDPGSVTGLFEVQVYHQTFAKPATRVRIPYGLPSGPSSLAPVSTTTQSTYGLQASVEAEADAARPLIEKSWFKSIVYNPFTYMGIWGTAFSMSFVASKLTRNWAFAQRERQWVYKLVSFPFKVSWSALIGFTILLMFVFGAGLLIVTLAFAGLIGYALGGPIGAFIAVILVCAGWYNQTSEGHKA